jgi:hypothetical protein
MGKFGKLAMLGAARNAAKRNASSVHSGVDKVASALKGKLNARHSDKIDKGASLVKKAATGTDRPVQSEARTG